MTNYNDGKWHGWNGGECPVHPKSKVNTFFIHNGLVPSTQGDGTISDACRQDWSCVIAFRVVKEYREPRERWAYLGLTLIASIGIGFVFDRYTDAHVPYWDAGCAGISVAAQILMMKRRIESWHLWVVVDVVYTALYATKGAWLTVILYAIFAVIAVGGLREWRKSVSNQRS